MRRGKHSSQPAIVAEFQLEPQSLILYDLHPKVHSNPHERPASAAQFHRVYLPGTIHPTSGPFREITLSHQSPSKEQRAERAVRVSLFPALGVIPTFIQGDVNAVFPLRAPLDSARCGMSKNRSPHQRPADSPPDKCLGTHRNRSAQPAGWSPQLHVRADREYYPRKGEFIMAIRENLGARPACLKPWQPKPRPLGVTLLGQPDSQTHHA